MRDQERAPRKYELMTILHPEVDEESLPGELDRIAGYIATAGGELIESLRESPWGRRRLAYPIRSGGRDVRDGYYTVWHFSIGPSRLDELERELKLNIQVIRYIIVSWEPKPIDPKEVEAAEIAAEDAAAAAYAAAQAAAEEPADAAEDAAAAAYAAAQAAATTEAATEGEPAAAMGLVVDDERAEALTAEAEAVEATGAELAIEVADAEAAIEPVAAVEGRAELEAEAAAALAKAAEAAASEAESDVPEGAIRGSESGECPDDYPVKGNATSKLYHTPGSPSYERTIPEFCFASVEAAEAAGFGPTKYEATHQEEEGE